jgi:glycogen operon protein
MWLRPDGGEMEQEDWDRGDAHALGVFLNGREIATHDRDGRPIRGSSFLIFFNAFWEPITFTVPEALGERWGLELSTHDDATGGDLISAGDEIEVLDRSLIVLRRISQ